MANTTTRAPGAIHLVLDGSADWSYIDDAHFPAAEGIKIHSIQFNPSAANDILVIRNKTLITGTITHYLKAADVGPVFEPDRFFPMWEYPVIDATDLTLGTPASASVIIRYEG